MRRPLLSDGSFRAGLAALGHCRSPLRGLLPRQRQRRRARELLPRTRGAQEVWHTILLRMDFSSGSVDVWILGLPL